LKAVCRRREKRGKGGRRGREKGREKDGEGKVRVEEVIWTKAQGSPMVLEELSSAGLMDLIL
jgi:hypothetical protein